MYSSEEQLWIEIETLQENNANFLQSFSSKQLGLH